MMPTGLSCISTDRKKVEPALAGMLERNNHYMSGKAAGSWTRCKSTTMRSTLKRRQISIAARCCSACLLTSCPDKTASVPAPATKPPRARMMLPARIAACRGGSIKLCALTVRMITSCCPGRTSWACKITALPWASGSRAQTGAATAPSWAWTRPTPRSAWARATASLTSDLGIRNYPAILRSTPTNGIT